MSVLGVVVSREEPMPELLAGAMADVLRACLFVAEHAEHEGIELGVLRCVDMIEALRNEPWAKLKERALADIERRKPYVPGLR